MIFPGSVNAGEDMYVWQFLAAIGLGASPEQQARLVMAVKWVLSPLVLLPLACFVSVLLPIYHTPVGFSNPIIATGTASWKPSP